MSGLPIPCNLHAAAVSEGRDDWFVGLPEVVRSVSERWRLTVGPPYEPGGQTAWVAPASSPEDGAVVLKLLWRHPEATHEADGLRAWNGDGAVRLCAAADFDDTLALLIERCIPGTPLTSRPEPEQDEIIAGLLRRLWRVAPNDTVQSLQTMCDRWAGRFEAKAAARPGGLDPGLAREGAALFRALPAGADRAVLLCTDLHAGNVLAAQREPWLAIDPKPHVGDPTYDALQHLLNCAGRLHADPRRLARRLAELLGLDAERLQLWLFARCVVESVDYPELGGVARRLAPS